jgi:hypothetical protein
MSSGAGAGERRTERSLEQALLEYVPPEYHPDDNLEEARAVYQERLLLWQERNGKSGGAAAFALLVQAARRLRNLEAAAS